MKTIKLLIICTLLTTSAQFSQWVTQTNGTTNTIYGAAIFPSLLVTISVGGSKIYKTTNDGTNWINIAYPLPENSLSDVVTSGVNTCWAVGNATVLKSTNAGSNWVRLTAPNRYWNAAYFLNDNTGWICGSTDTVIKTTNGGANWIVHENNLYADSYNYGIQFTSTLLGFMCGYDAVTNKGYIIRTINGGGAWAEIFSTAATVQTLTMINSSTGFATSTGKIFKTTNGGTNWSEFTVTGAGALYAIDFPVNEQTGYAGGIGGKIYKTTNAGVNWYQLTSGTSNHIRTITFSFGSNNTGYAMGNSGTILRTTNGGGAFVGINEISSIVPDRSGLTGNYPNPFNPATNIKFNIAESGIIKISVYNITGQETAILVNSEMKPGTYTVSWDASDLPGGVYFCRMTGTGFMETKKMILIK